MFRNVKSGFSLVELSLVLIIVALIISAVISGKSLITNSKLTVLNSEMQTLKIALGNYINDEGITDYSEEKIFFNLMDKGYLEGKSITTYAGATSTVGAKTDIFKSKVNGGAWQYAAVAADPQINFGKVAATDGAMTALLDETVANNFVKKYAKTGSIEIKNNSQIVEVTFLNGAQN